MNKNKLIFTIFALASIGFIIIINMNLSPKFFDIFGIPIFLAFLLYLSIIIYKALKQKELFFENYNINPGYFYFLVLIVGISYAVTFGKILDKFPQIGLFFFSGNFNTIPIAILMIIFIILSAVFLTAQHQEKEKYKKSELTNEEKNKINKKALKEVWKAFLVILIYALLCYLADKI